MAPGTTAALAALVLAALCWGGCASGSNVKSCSDLAQSNCCRLFEARGGGGGLQRAARVRLLWAAQPARAAAALLRAVLLAAGYRPDRVTLEEQDAARDLCALLPERARLARNQSEGVMVALAVAERARPCAFTGFPLEVMGAGAAPAAPRLHARLAWRARVPACRAALRRLRDPAALRRCAFLPRRDEPGENYATLYIPEGEWMEEEEELKVRLDGAPLRTRRVSRRALAARLAAEPELSFLFLDAELWAGSGAFPLPEEAGAPPSRLVVDRKALLMRAPMLFFLLHDGSFAASAADLRAVLAAPHYALEDAACAHAHSAVGFPGWLKTVEGPYQRVAVAVVCDAEHDHALYERVGADVARRHIRNETTLSSLGALVFPRVSFLNCSEPDALADEIVRWSGDGSAWRTVGVAAPAELALRARARADDARLPLLAYTPAARAGVRSATGGPAVLAHALRRLLAACKWRRLGLVSEDAPLARAVEQELARVGGPLTWKESAETPEASVARLRALETRVFFVNCDAAAAARVLAAAAATDVGARDEVWIVREYAAPDAGSRALRPLSLSFQYRGAAPPETRGPELRALEESLALERRAWPPHAAALLDALVTLAHGFERLMRTYNDTLDYTDRPGKLRDFWIGVQAQNISGAVEDLQYDERGVRAPLVYLERWGSGPWPQRLRRWRAGERAPPVERCPAGDNLPGDGYRCCLLPPRERYEPGPCRDAERLAAAGAGALAAAAAALLARRVLRRWLVRRDRALERATTARILARREAAFADLAPHLVPRATVALGDELGAGRFGRVLRGELHAAGRLAPVAVKVLRDGAVPAEERQFLHEARLLAALRHEHVVRFRGVCWEGGPPLLLMELVLFGDLLRYLRARRHLAGGAGEEAAAVSAAALTRLAREAAAALAYLAARGLVHRDVRAANCLVDARRSLRLADFGLARETGAADGEYACRGRALLPVLWMAPESLARGVATPASDAWAFGVLALELITLGARPFGDAAPEDAVRAVLGGGRPPLPRNACAESRALLVACWRREPAARPPAARLAGWLALRRTALRPTLARGLKEPDCDSGIGEPQTEPRAANPLDRPTDATEDGSQLSLTEI